MLIFEACRYKPRHLCLIIRTKFYYNCGGSPPITVPYLVGLGWNGVPNEANKIPFILEGLGIVLLHMAHSWQSEGFGPVQQCFNDSSLVQRWMVWFKTQILIRVGGLAVHRGADGAALLPCQEDVQEGELPIWLHLHVNWMLLSMLLRWLWKESTRSPGSTVQVLSTYHFQNAEEYGRLQRLLFDVLYHQVGDHYQYWWPHGCAMHLLVDLVSEGQIGGIKAVFEEGADVLHQVWDSSRWHAPLSLPYLSGLSESLHRVLSQLAIQVTLHPIQTLRQELVHPENLSCQDQISTLYIIII